jgi:hypothetical protein
MDDRFCHLTNTAVNVANTTTSRPILELASVVLRRITESDRRGSHLWDRIRQVVVLSIVAQYQGMLQNIGMVVPDNPRDGFVPPQKALDEMHRYFHLLGIDILISDRCDPVVLELNDRPSMGVTYPLERDLKTRLLCDTLNVITVDGEDDGGKAVPGGWEKLIPNVEESAFGSEVKMIIERSCHGAQSSPKKLVMKKLGYVPSASFARGARRILTSLPPLHQ